MNKGNFKKFSLFFILIICSVFVFNAVFATTPTLVNKLNKAFKNILTYLEKLSGPIAGVAIASGVMIRKLSFGDEEKLRTGKRVIINAIVGYGIILAIDLILKFMDSLV